MAEPLVHLVCGSTGAGKTTFSNALCDRLCGVRFSIDEWMTELFWPDAADPIDPAWAMARVERCNTQIWAVARQIAARAVPCVLDLGFATRASRDRIAALAGDAGFGVQLHWLDAPAEVRWRRVEHRNSQTDGPQQLSFAVTRDMFDFVEGLFEAPDSDELAARNGNIVLAAG